MAKRILNDIELADAKRELSQLERRYQARIRETGGELRESSMETLVRLIVQLTEDIAWTESHRAEAAGGRIQSANHELEPGPPFNRCPVCRYPLWGLPAEHYCPECGFVYDRLTAIWYRPARYRWILGLVSVAGFFTAFAAGLWVRQAIGPTLAGRAAFWMLALGGMTLPMAWARILVRRPFVAISRIGITLCPGRRDFSLIRWGQVRNIAFSDSTPNQIDIVVDRSGPKDEDEVASEVVAIPAGLFTANRPWKLYYPMLHAWLLIR